MTSSGALVADLNGDGITDRVSPPSLTGADLAITFGAEHGQQEKKAGPRDLVGDRGRSAKDVLAVVADFDQDGWNDLFIAATKEFEGDDPVAPDVSELRLGPFSAHGRGQSDHHVELSEPRALAVADYDHDHHPDLASYGHEGDGVYGAMARLGSKKGLDRKSDSTNWQYTKFAEQTGRPTPDSMPMADLTAFYPTCDGA